MSRTDGSCLGDTPRSLQDPRRAHPSQRAGGRIAIHDAARCQFCERGGEEIEKDCKNKSTNNAKNRSEDRLPTPGKLQ
jgi:hypothetical protein